MVFGFYYPVVFGIAMAVVFLIMTVWLGPDFARAEQNIQG
jgi:hypothetical protein